MRRAIAILPGWRREDFLTAGTCLRKHQKHARVSALTVPARWPSLCLSPQLFQLNLCDWWTQSRCPDWRSLSGWLITDFTPALMSQHSSPVVPVATACHSSPAGQTDTGLLEEVGSCDSSQRWSVDPWRPPADQPGLGFLCLPPVWGVGFFVPVCLLRLAEGLRSGQSGPPGHTSRRLIYKSLLHGALRIHIDVEGQAVEAGGTELGAIVAAWRGGG